MPWTIADVEKHKKGLTAKQKRQWVEVANSVLHKCMADGGNEETCAASAIRQANGVTGHSYSISQYRRVRDYEVRQVEHQGRKHIIVPVVMMVEGVHNGSHGPLFHSAEELGKFTESWNGRPVVINHPQVDENFVSANSPTIIEEGTVGRVFNTTMKGTKLMAEAWLDVEKLSTLSPEALSSIENGEPLDVSVGVFTEEESVAGEWNGEQYTAIAHNHRPDHLALLPGGVGACSFADGCGIRANNKNKEGGNDVDALETVTGMEAKRKELGMSVAEFYAVPRDPPNESKLPIFDAAHVRNALARFNQVQGLTDDERASAKRKILAKCRHFGIGASSLAGNAQHEIFETLKGAKEVGLFDTILDNSDVGMMETFELVRRKVDSLDNNNTVNFTQDVFDDYVIYEQRVRDGGESRLLKQAYEIVNGAVNFTGNPIRVSKKVTYEPVQGFTAMTRTKFNNNKKEVTTMADQKCPDCVVIVNALIESGRYKESQREALEALPKDVLETMRTPVEKVVEKIVEKPAEYSEEDKKIIADHKAQQKAKREGIVKEIQANAKDVWTEDELNAMTDGMLEKVHKSLKIESEESGVGTIHVAAAAVTSGIEPLLPTGYGPEYVKK